MDSQIQQKNTPNSSNNAEKLEIIQQRLMLLLHSDKCRQQQRIHCNLPFCNLARTLLAHMAYCSAGPRCHYAHCASSRQLIVHWKNCTKEDCPICGPLKWHKKNGNFGQIAARTIWPCPPYQLKEWHLSMATNLRAKIAGKLFNVIWAKCKAKEGDPRMRELIEYSRKVEKDAFEMADFKEEYYQMMAEKIYAIQKNAFENE